jgi:hypothetical protein
MRVRRLGAAIAVGVGTVALAAGTGGASTSLRPAPATPDPKLIVLRSADLQARVHEQRYFHDNEFPSTISYERSFGRGRTGAARLLYAESLAEIGASARTTSRFATFVRRLFAAASGSLTLEKSFARQLGDPRVVNASLRVGHVRNLGAGPGSFDLPATVEVLGKRTEIHFALVRVERILGAFAIVGIPGSHVSVASVAWLAKLVVKRMTAELAPKNFTPPVVSGSRQVGQTLTASSGLWNGKPTTISYGWQRCNAAGAACSTISQAGAQTYVLTQADEGSRVRVSVTARNRYGSRTVPSAATATVGTVSPPTNTALPTITGNIQVGQTLTASTGSWSGDPTSFAFAWQRCDASGSACAAIPGATAGTYVVTASDSGATLRVAVTATNAAGSATAVSAPAGAVP